MPRSALTESYTMPASMEHLRDVDILMLDSSIPAEAYRARPLTDVEIDAHPDSARIWSTVNAMRTLLEASQIEIRESENIRSEEEQDEAVADAEREGYARARLHVETMRFDLAWGSDGKPFATLVCNVGSADEVVQWENAFFPMRRALSAQLLRFTGRRTFSWFGKAIARRR